jgi:hypothetical protein
MERVAAYRDQKQRLQRALEACCILAQPLVVLVCDFVGCNHERWLAELLELRHSTVLHLHTITKRACQNWHYFQREFNCFLFGVPMFTNTRVYDLHIPDLRCLTTQQRQQLAELTSVDLFGTEAAQQKQLTSLEMVDVIYRFLLISMPDVTKARRLTEREF